jgi:pimeloyl-ACP methyl ester carboxylesterase
MKYNIKVEEGFKYIDEGKGETMLLLHGLFGALSNWEGVIEEFRHDYRVIIPLLPIYEMPLRQAGLEGLLAFAEKFVQFKSLQDLTILGNSLGGHVALMYVLKNPENVKRLVLTGSSGLFENQMGGSYPKRGSYAFVSEKVAYTFYDPKVATKDLIDEVFEVTKSIPKALNIVQIAKSAQRNNMAAQIVNIQTPTLLVWGLNDTITPVSVGHEFNRLIPNSELQFIDKCCHAPMMEHPVTFNQIMRSFLRKHNI